MPAFCKTPANIHISHMPPETTANAEHLAVKISAVSLRIFTQLSLKATDTYAKPAGAEQNSI